MRAETREMLVARIERVEAKRLEYSQKATKARLRGSERTMRKHALVAGSMLMARLQAEAKLTKLDDHV